jgi:hypothetical protein
MTTSEQMRARAREYDDLTAKVAALHAALTAARDKLALYRACHSGEYIGGIEYTALVRLIDSALKGPSVNPGPQPA